MAAPHLPDGRALRRAAKAHVIVESGQLAGGATIVPDDDTQHHLRRVLRLRDGDRISVTDGSGRWCLGVVRSAGGVVVEPVGAVVDEPRPELPMTLATAIPKGDRLDLLVQKATELGADRIVLLHTERSVVRWKPDRLEHQLARLRRLADEACRQSRRVWRPRIEGPLDAAAVLPEAVVAEPGGRPVRPTDTFVAIGPEGGWSPAELALATDRVDLGPNVLRTETAALAVIALCVGLRHGELDS